MRWPGRLAVALAAALSLPAASEAAPGPPYSVPVEKLRAGLHCPDAFDAARTPVLLVHGTAANGELNWGWNYADTLPSLGFAVCMVDLPAQSYEDIQPASEYVVHALREIAARSGKKVAVIGHSQGTLQPRWAIRWWPDIAGLLGDYISISGPHRGTEAAALFCLKGSCPPAIWQMRPGSRLLDALNAGDPTPGAASYTSLFSANDELSTPYTTSPLDGAGNVLVQDVCPGRRVTHFGMVYDAVVFALVMDALTHDGPADPARVDRAICRAWIMPGADPTVALAFEALSDGGAVGLTLAARQVGREPDLAGYATAKPAAAATRPRLRLRVQPVRAYANELTRLRFRASSEGKPVSGATVRLGGRRARTDARGRALMRVRLRRGVWRARVTRHGYAPGRVRVRVLARP